MNPTIDSLLVDLANQEAALRLSRLRHGYCSTPRQGLYFIQCGDLVKIGKAKDVEARIKTLQTGCPLKLHLIAFFPLAGDRESAIHRRLSQLRVRGEWFRYTDEVDSVIRGLQTNA